MISFLALTLPSPTGGRNPRIISFPLFPVLLINKLPDFVGRGAGHKQRVRIQRLIDAMASPGAMIISKAVKQMTMTMGLITAAVTSKTGKHVRDFRSRLVGLTSPPLKEFGRKRHRQSRYRWA
jgi:hypothetical protein